MRRFERSCRLPQNITGPFRPERTLSAYHSVERFTGDKLHHYEGAAPIGHPHVHNIDGVWMMNSAGGPRFLLKPQRRVGISRELAPQHLDRDPLTDEHVIGLVNVAHASSAQAPRDAILA